MINNYSTFFILPMLNHIDYRITLGTIIYVTNELHENDNQITVVNQSEYDFSKFTVIRSFKRGKDYITILEMDPIFIEDYLTFKKSKFSMISEFSKIIIIKYWKKLYSDKSDVVKLINGIFNKEEWLFESWEEKIGQKIPRNQEAFPLLNEKEEYV